MQKGRANNEISSQPWDEITGELTFKAWLGSRSGLLAMQQPYINTAALYILVLMHSHVHACASRALDGPK